MAVVVLDIPTFRAMYPEFDAVADAQIMQAFNAACLFCSNSAASPVPYEPGVNTERETLLYLLTCHILTLGMRGGIVVGSMTAAAEGSVNTSFATPQAVNAAWYNQTQCGATYWAATLKYRQGRYYGRRCY